MWQSVQIHSYIQHSKIKTQTKWLSLLLFIWIFQIESTQSQQLNDFGFEVKYNISVQDSDGTPFKTPWLGGLNNVQIQSINLNNDEHEDLVVFDRHGFRILTFLNEGIAGDINYTYSPTYENCFPVISNWMILKDYNCDGKKDIFTFTPGGIILYKNTGTNAPKFTLEVEPYITSLQGSSPTNILVTDVDYPIIEDMDADGDLDIIVFFGLGSRMEYHQNMSMETYSHCDSLNYTKTSDCWGDFAESEESNVLEFDICSKRNFDQIMEGEKHTGSTMLAIDMNEDQIKDLVLGDIDYPGLVLLTNGGTSENADMISYDWDFPNNEHPVNLFSFPLANLMDVNNDAKKDLIISPFDPSQYNPKSQNTDNVWLYKNVSQNESNDFQFSDSAFLQKDMIDLGSGAMPYLFDYDNDGLVDLFVGNFGYWDTSFYDQGILKTKYYSSIALFKNVGSVQTPQFKLITYDLGDLSQKKYKNICISMADINTDDKFEMIIGTETGELILANLATDHAQMPALSILDENYLTIEATYITPQFFDLDQDGLIDIITGDRKGNLHYLKNTGTIDTPEFNYQSDHLGTVDVTNPNLSYYGYSIPCFYRTDNETVLLVGSEFGHIHYYKGIDNDPENGNYELISTFYLKIDKGSRSCVSLANLDEDNYPEMIYGNYSGGLHYYDGIKPSAAHIYESNKQTNPISIYPNPANKGINICMETDDSEGLYFEVSDTRGIPVMDGLLNTNPCKVSIDRLNPGIYFLLVKRNNIRICTKKLIVVK